MKIGIAGTGRMGAAIAGRLLNLGHEATVWNRTAEKTKALAAAGAKAAAAAGAARCRVVMDFSRSGIGGRVRGRKKSDK